MLYAEDIYSQGEASEGGDPVTDEGANEEEVVHEPNTDTQEDAESLSPLQNE